MDRVPSIRQTQGRANDLAVVHFTLPAQMRGPLNEIQVQWIDDDARISLNSVEDEIYRANADTVSLDHPADFSKTN